MKHKSSFLKKEEVSFLGKILETKEKSRTGPRTNKRTW